MAVGVSGEAWELEKSLDLHGHFFLPRTLQWLSNRICYYYDVPVIQLRHSRNLGKNAGKFKSYGRMREDGVMSLATDGLTLAVTLHELAHWKAWTDGHSMRHHKAFRTRHVSILNDLWSVVSLEELLRTHNEHWYWENFNIDWERLNGNLHKLDVLYARLKPERLSLAYGKLA